MAPLSVSCTCPRVSRPSTCRFRFYCGLFLCSPSGNYVSGCLCVRGSQCGLHPIDRLRPGYDCYPRPRQGYGPPYPRVDMACLRLGGWPVHWAGLGFTILGSELGNIGQDMAEVPNAIRDPLTGDAPPWVVALLSSVVHPLCFMLVVVGVAGRALMAIQRPWMAIVVTAMIGSIGAPMYLMPQLAFVTDYPLGLSYVHIDAADVVGLSAGGTISIARVLAFHQVFKVSIPSKPVTDHFSPCGLMLSVQSWSLWGFSPSWRVWRSLRVNERSRRVIGLASIIYGVSILLSRLVGLIRESVIGRTLGNSGEADVYWTAFVLPDFLNYLLAGGVLSIVFIPMFQGHLARG